MEPVHHKRWQLRVTDAAAVSHLMEVQGLSSLIARLLVARGLGEAGVAGRFLAPSLADLHDPLLLLGMEEAVTRLSAAVTAGERICIYGDYDVDGITSVALLVDFFRAIGADVCYYIPRRLDEGYGLSVDGVERIVALGARVIVTVDCGITAVAEASHCAALGVDLIVTDHHMPGERLPQALAVINPLQPGCPFPFKQLAGVGVAFNLAVALRGRLRSAGFFFRVPEPNLRASLDLVALGTVADVVPLADENRIFVAHGLRELAAGGRTGVRALKEVAGVTGPVGCGAVGFRLAPRLNAAGRLEDAAPGVELLLTADRRQAQALAAELDAGNAERQALEQEILRDALAMVGGRPELAGRKSIVLASEAWHPGVIGIVASRLVDLYHRPTILIALKEGNGRGSGRSIPAFHLHDALHACSEHLIKFGGHRHAAGLAIEEATLEAFVASFDAIAAGLLTPDDLTPELAIDAELAPAELDLALAETLETLAPFGMGNPEPVFMLRGAVVKERRLLKERHLKLQLEAGGRRFEAIGFNMAERWDVPELADLAFTLQVNEWNGRRSLQLKLRDFRAAA
jgi:single-stranded-DNA-specific exonuclease